MANQKRKLEMYGGTFGAVVPLLVLIFILVWLSVEERGGPQAFWPAGWIAIAVALFLAKDKHQLCETVMRGFGDKTGIIIVMAWLFAGVFGKLMVAGGLVDGLLWFGLNTGATGAWFTIIAFVAAMIYSLGTGTSVGTCLSLIPVMYPAGVLLGANPVMLAVGILAGAAFGDNLAPVSDTTLVSAYSQEADMRDVVKSRAPLALCAAAICVVVLFFTGGGGTISEMPVMEQELSPSGLLVMLSFVVVIFFALRGKHIVESLIYGNISAVILGVISGNMALSQVFHIPAKRGESTGLIEDGISGVVGAIIFALLVLAVTQILVESGVLSRMLEWVEKRVAKTVRQAETAIVIVTLLVTIPIASNAPAILLVGPGFVKPLGEKFKLAPARRANLMDCAACTLFFVVPWHVAVIVWYSTLVSAAEAWNLYVPSISVALFNPYCWGMLAVLMFSVITGWNRKFEEPVITEEVNQQE